MRYLFVLLMVIAWAPAGAQKIMSKTYPVTHQTLVQLDARNNYKVEVRTEDRENILIEAMMEGEYQGEMLVQLTESGSTIHIATRNQPAFEFPNDKLSAHKVISVGLRLTLPAYLSFDLFGRGAFVSLKGKYRVLDVSLSSGNCVLEVEAEQVNVKTLSGNIEAWNAVDEIRAKSQYGSVYGASTGGEASNYILNTITGNIAIHNKE